MVAMVLLTVIIKHFMVEITNYFEWIRNAILISIVCFVVFFIVDSLFDKKSFEYVINYIGALLHKKFNRRSNENT